MSREQTALADRWQDAEELKWAVRSWTARIWVKVPQIHVRQMTRKWASISTAGRLTLNSELLEMPRMLGEFVIVHEVVHMTASNHGKVFKSFMFAYLPDWEEREQHLRECEREMKLKIPGLPGNERLLSPKLRSESRLICWAFWGAGGTGERRYFLTVPRLCPVLLAISLMLNSWLNKSRSMRNSSRSSIHTTPEF